MQIDYDEQVFARGVQKIYDIARGTDQRPFFLMVSFTQPHDLYVTRRLKPPSPTFDNSSP